MDIDKLKNNAEEIIAEESVTIDEDNEKIELTEEQKKEQEELLAEIARRKFAPRVNEISRYMLFTKKKLDDVYQDIENKKSGLSVLNREFLVAFKRDYINSLFQKRFL